MNIQTELAQYYRIALIGATSSGKTCLLAKLASQSDSNPRFTSSSVPLGDYMPETSEGDEDPSKWSEERKLRENFRIGEERLEAAKLKFKENQRPEATSNDASRPMMRFLLGDTQKRGDFCVWTEDYAGEFLNKEGLTDPDSLSSRLKNNLLQYDGLILVVEAASTPEQMREVAKQIETLSQFFASLTIDEKREGRINNIPVAVVITKWDRISKEIDFENPGKERALLENYITQNSLYQTIVKAVRSNTLELPVEPVDTQDCPTAIVRGNTAVFPVSSFGKSRQDENGYDFPEGLQSFCLVEPFYWIASKCDEISISELEEKVNASKFYWLKGGLGIQKQINTLKPIIRKNNPCWPHFKDIRSSFRAKCTGCLLLYAFLAYCALAFGGQWYLGSLESAMRKPENTVEDFGGLKKSFENYQKHIFPALPGFPGKKRTNADIKFIEETVENHYWRPVEDLSQNAKMSEGYLAVLPSGNHAVEAHKFIQDYAIYKEKSAWENVLKAPLTCDKASAAEKYLAEFNQDGNAKFQREAKQIIEQNKIEKEEAAWKLVTDAPAESSQQKKLAQDYIERFDKEGSARHRSDADRMIHAAENREAWESDLASYNFECTGQDIVKIVASLQELITKHGERCKPQIEALPDKIMEKLNEKGRHSDIGDIIEECDKVITAAKGLEIMLRGRNQEALATSIMTVTQNIGSFKNDSIQKYDQSLYQAVRSSRSLDKCKEYLTNMNSYGGGSMKFSVERYQAFLEKKDGTFSSVKITANVYWTHDAHNSKHRETVSVNGVQYKDEVCSPPVGGNTNSIGSHDFSNKSLNDDISVKVSFVTEDNWKNWNNVTWIDESHTYSISSLLSGKEIDIFYKNKKFGTITIKATISELQNEPELPTWHN